MKEGPYSEVNTHGRADWPRRSIALLPLIDADNAVCSVHYLCWIDSKSPVYRLLQCGSCEKDRY